MPGLFIWGWASQQETACVQVMLFCRPSLFLAAADCFAGDLAALVIPNEYQFSMYYLVCK